MTGAFGRMTAWAFFAVTPVFGPCATAAAQGPEWQFAFQSAQPVAIPTWLNADSLRSALAYDSTEAVAGFLADLNRDGTLDYVFRYSRTVCGSNCEYLFVDGLTHRALGTLGGSVLVVRQPSINGYPVIHTYGHSSVDAGYWSTAVFNGRAYTSLGTVYVQGPSQEQLFRTLEAIPFWPPPTEQR
jgi:hypothetical protein